MGAVVASFIGNIANFLGALSFCYFNPSIPVVLLYVRCKSGVYFARRRFRDGLRVRLKSRGVI